MNKKIVGIVLVILIAVIVGVFVYRSNSNNINEEKDNKNTEKVMNVERKPTNVTVDVEIEDEIDYESYLGVWQVYKEGGTSPEYELVISYISAEEIGFNIAKKGKFSIENEKALVEEDIARFEMVDGEYKVVGTMELKPNQIILNVSESNFEEFEKDTIINFLTRAEVEALMFNPTEELESNANTI